MPNEDGTVAAWLVLFDCGHTRHPDACHCNGDDEGHAPHDGPPPPGWAGWCVECGDFRTTVECIAADPIDGGHTLAMRQAARVIAAAHREHFGSYVVGAGNKERGGPVGDQV